MGKRALSVTDIRSYQPRIVKFEGGVAATDREA